MMLIPLSFILCLIQWTHHMIIISSIQVREFVVHNPPLMKVKGRFSGRIDLHIINFYSVPSFTNLNLSVIRQVDPMCIILSSKQDEALIGMLRTNFGGKLMHCPTSFTLHMHNNDVPLCWWITVEGRHSNCQGDDGSTIQLNGGPTIELVPSCDFSELEL